MKKLIVLTVIVFALALLVAPAVEAKVTIRNTGPGSINVVTRTSTKSASVFGLMLGGVHNESLAVANSGLNFAILNTTGGGIEAGKASSTVEDEAYVNGSSVAVDQAANPSGDEDVVINTTGPGSINAVTMTNTKTVTVAGAMIGGVHNESLAIANSGGNVSALNTIGGSIKSGDATVKDTSYSEVNQSLVFITQ
jgi:hypothetical protein